MIDYHWHGTPEAIAAAIAGHRNFIGPRTLDGTAYVRVRTDIPLDTPPGLSETGQQLSVAVLGEWA